MLATEANHPSKSVLKHRELSDLLRGRIESGQYRAGEQIPTEYELGRTFDVSRNTIRQAIATLEEQGYLIRRRGAGTFVGEIGRTGRPIPPLETVGYLLVDLPTAENRWSLNTSRIAHEYLAQRGIHLFISHFSTRDLVKGRQMGILRSGECQAMLVDGWVQELHCSLLEEWGLPYMVIGNRPVGRRPQARFAMDQIVHQATRYLHELHPRQPVALMIEPLRLHMSQEIFQAYAEAAQALPQGHPILQVTEDAAADVSLGRLLDAHPGPLSLIVTEGQWARAASAYRARGLSPEQWPVLVLGDPDKLTSEDRAACHLFSFSGKQLIEKALPEFVEAYGAGATTGLRVNVGVERIDPCRNEHQGGS